MPGHGAGLKTCAPSGCKLTDLWMECGWTHSFEVGLVHVVRVLVGDWWRVYGLRSRLGALPVVNSSLKTWPCDKISPATTISCHGITVRGNLPSRPAEAWRLVERFCRRPAFDPAGIEAFARLVEDDQEEAIRQRVKSWGSNARERLSFLISAVLDTVDEDGNKHTRENLPFIIAAKGGGYQHGTFPGR